jgi:hypothetical protein
MLDGIFIILVVWESRWLTLIHATNTHFFPDPSEWGSIGYSEKNIRFILRNLPPRSMKVLESNSMCRDWDISRCFSYIQTFGIKLYKRKKVRIVCTSHVYAFYLMSTIILFYFYFYSLFFFFSFNRPLGLTKVEFPRISRQWAYEGGKLARPKRLPLYPIP